MNYFDPASLQKLHKISNDSTKNDNGLVTVIGGSKLFHGAPLMAIKTASRFADTIFFASPDPSTGEVAAQIKAGLFPFIWVPWNETEAYVEKSDAVLIGVGFRRFGTEKKRGIIKEVEVCDEECQKTKSITEKLLVKYAHKKWVVDAGSLQVISPECLPKGSVITPNQKEFRLLFNYPNEVLDEKLVYETAVKYNLTIAVKGIETIVSSPTETVIVRGGNAGLTKGGTGDVQAGLTVALLAKNDPFLAASVASFLVKRAADELYKTVGVNYNAEDLSDRIPKLLFDMLGMGV